MANVLISLQNFGQKFSDKERVISRSITMKQDQRVRVTNEQCYFNLRLLPRNSSENNLAMDNKFSTIFTSAHEVRVFLVSAKLKFSIACFGV
jgi:hypothetical protein